MEVFLRCMLQIPVRILSNANFTKIYLQRMRPMSNMAPKYGVIGGKP